MSEEKKNKGDESKQVSTAYVDAEKQLNEDILRITLKIKEQYPELLKYLDELAEGLPDEKDPEISLRNLKTYYESLNSMLNKYVLEHPIRS